MKEADLPRAIELQGQINDHKNRLDYLDKVRFSLIVPGHDVSAPARSEPDSPLSHELGMDEGLVFGVAREAIRNRITAEIEKLRSELSRIGLELEPVNKAA